MKKFFFLGILGFGVVWLVGFFLYRVALALLDVYDDWQLGKELREIEREASSKRQRGVAAPEGRANLDQIPHVAPLPNPPGADDELEDVVDID